MGSPVAAKARTIGNCKQVCIGLVVTQEGSRSATRSSPAIADVATLEEMVTTMERHYGQARRVWVMDRGWRAPRTSLGAGEPTALFDRRERERAENVRWPACPPGGLAASARRGRGQGPRRPMRGMMLHQDGSGHVWVEGLPSMDLIVTMDDATREVSTR